MERGVSTVSVVTILWKLTEELLSFLKPSNSFMETSIFINNSVVITKLKAINQTKIPS